MLFVYPAIMTRQPDGSYKGYFPDLDGIEAEGISLDRAIDDAHDAMYGWLDFELSEPDPKLPMISDVNSLKLAENQQVVNIAVHFRYNTGWDE